VPVRYAQGTAVSPGGGGESGPFGMRGAAGSANVSFAPCGCFVQGEWHETALGRGAGARPRCGCDERAVGPCPGAAGAPVSLVRGNGGALGR
jgi:hypothetical protein